MEVLGHGHVLKKYKRKKIITQKHAKLIMKDACHLGFEKFGFKLAQKENMLKLGNAIVHLFPENYPTIDTIVPIKGRKGCLYNAAFYRLQLERANQMDVGSSDGEGSVETEETFDMDEQISFLKMACGSNKIEIQKSLKRTSKHRLELIQQGAVDIQELFFSFFLTHPNFISYDFDLIYPDARSRFYQNKRKLDLKTLVSLEKEFKPPKKCNQLIVPKDIEPFLILLRLLGHDIAKKVLQRDNFVTAFGRIVEFVSHNTPLDGILETTNTQPFILAKFSLDETTITQYCLVFPATVVPLDPKMTFVECFDMLFQIYTTLNIRFPLTAFSNFSKSSCMT